MNLLQVFHNVAQMKAKPLDHYKYQSLNYFYPNKIEKHESLSRRSNYCTLHFHI
ncbi:hypothetical protein Syun_029962 [Stephania yunnanensis]|uniref:Uncharacterized protein n=1 Tax=Stephania yunnanensis TaxID=152371 RepID=A0AAP0HGI0_9MAGN